MKAIFALFLVLAYIAIAMAHHHHHHHHDDSGNIIDAGEKALGDVGDAVGDFLG